MIQRNLTLSNRNAAEVKRIVHSAFRSRACEVMVTGDENVVEFSGFRGASNLLKGFGKIAIDDVDGKTTVRLEINEMLATTLCTILFIVFLVAAFFTVGMTLALYLILRDSASTSVVTEFDRVFEETSRELGNDL